MGIAYPSALLIAGARAFLDSYWVEHDGRLPPSLEDIFKFCYARSEAERAAVVIALHDYHPEVADIYLSKEPHLWHANTPKEEIAGTHGTRQISPRKRRTSR